MGKEMQLQPPGKSTRSFEEWKESLRKMLSKQLGMEANIDSHDAFTKPYYDQGLMPTVAFNELFNR